MNDMEIRDQHDIEKLTPEQLGGEIRLLTLQARRMALSYGIQIGYRLHIAHEKVGPHGWAEWLKKETDFSAAAASRFESLYEGYGEDSAKKSLRSSMQATFQAGSSLRQLLPERQPKSGRWKLSAPFMKRKRGRDLPSQNFRRSWMQP